MIITLSINLESLIAWINIYSRPKTAIHSIKKNNKIVH